tara:strand:+ start:3065 stop:6316 length:3252 start_codon:yes stop_codon:yes gene_type:complete
MYRICGVLFVLFALSACGGSGGSGETGGNVTQSIVGGWGFLYQPGSCPEAYHFRDNGDMEINSGDEIIIGTYTFQEVVAGNQRHELTINLLTDNGGADCLGDSANDAGSTGTVYIAFDSATRISWYSDREGGSPLISMNSIGDIPMSEAPYLKLDGDVSASERETIQLYAQTDAPDDASYSWTQLKGPTAAIQAANSLNAQITLPAVSANTSLAFKFEITLADGSTYSKPIEVSVLANTNVADIHFPDKNLAACISETVGSAATVDVAELTSLSCENVANAKGIEKLSYLINLNLSNSSLKSLTPLLGLERIEQLDLSGNQSLACEELDELEANVVNGAGLVKDDVCIVNKAIELGAIGFDAVVDEDRGQIYVSIPSRNVIAVVSIGQLRVIDNILLAGAPYGIDLSIDGDSLYAAVRGTDSVAAIDLESRVVNIIPLANQTGSPIIYDVVEAAPNRLFVSSAPGSSGFAYIAQIDLEQSNLVTRAADGRIIRANPSFTRSPDYRSLYLSEDFSPNSLYKLNLVDSTAPLVLEDSHGSVYDTYNMSVNLDGSRIALASGQVLRTGSFVEVGRVSAGLSVPSRIADTLFVLGNSSNVEIFNFATLDKTSTVTTKCDYGTTNKLDVFNNDESFMLLQEDVVCIRSPISQSSETDPYPMLTFDDLVLEECVIETAQAEGFTQPSEFYALDCSASQKNIISLGSIGKLENLRSLNISGHSVFALEPLSELTNLESLTVQDSPVSSLEPLTGISTLREIDVVGSEKIPCHELTDFQINGILVAAESCTRNTRIELGGAGVDMEYKASTRKLYVSVPSLQQVSEIDVESEALSETYPVGGNAYRIDLSADGETIYTTLYNQGDIAYLQLATGNVETVDISTELGDDRVWDIAEVSPDRVIVSSNPGSNGFAYIVEVNRDQGNLAARVASERIIRASPEFAVAQDGSAVYVGSGFSPNSLYKLDATMSEMPIVLEDKHGEVSGTSHITLNSDSTLIYLASGQVLSTATFNQVAKFNSGYSWLSQDERSLYIADGELDAVGIYDAETTKKVGRKAFGCEVSSIQALQEIPGAGIAIVGDALVCFTQVIPFD